MALGQNAMNVDSQFPTTPLAAFPARPTKGANEQASARPVDRPHHNEAPTNNTRHKGEPVQAEARKDAERPPAENKTVRQESELSQEEKRNLEQLKARDREVRAHEAAHKNAAGGLAGGAQFELQTGPDGRRYAVGGEVSIDTSKVSGDPQATIDKAQTIRRAATAPAEPSSQDMAVAAKAASMEAEARAELAKGETSKTDETSDTGDNYASASPSEPRQGFANNHTQPAPVGELLDVLA